MTQEQNEWVEKMRLWINHEKIILQEAELDVNSSKSKILLMEKGILFSNELIALTKISIERAEKSVSDYIKENS